MISFPGFMQTALASYNAGTTQLFGEANYRFTVTSTALEAFADLNYLNHHTDAFSETGGVGALSLAASDRDVTFTTIGLRSSAQLAELYGMSIVGRGTVGWRHAFGDTNTATLASFVGGAPFTVAGTPISTDALIAEAGLDMNIRPDMSLGVLWSGQFGDNANENRLKGQFTYRW
jgi:fibronectin-binding autotransporter adhesin